MTGSVPETLGPDGLAGQLEVKPGQGPSRRVPQDCGDFQIHIARNGSWFYLNSPITRPALVKLFSSVLSRDEDGIYWLTTPVERGRVTVEDAPFTAVELDVEGEGQTQALIFRTNLDENVTAGEDHPLRVMTNEATGEPNPYILIRQNLEARLTRSVFYQLVELGMEERVGHETLFGVWSKNKFFPLGSLSDKS